MLIRILVSNLFSFDELTEFNMLPGRYNRLQNHIFNKGDIGLLKMNALYGANGAGKSNLIHALASLKDFLLKGEMPIELITQTFKFNKNSQNKDVFLGIEFIKDETPYYYGIRINRGIIVEEELQVSGLGKREDKTLFLRTDKKDQKKIEIKFSKEISEDPDPEVALFPDFLQNEILERNKPVLFYMKNRQHKAFAIFRKAIEWFEKDLYLILPHYRSRGLFSLLENNKLFIQFAKDTMRSFNTGITDIQVEKIPIEDFFGKDNAAEAEKITAKLRAKAGQSSAVRNNFEDVIFELSGNKAFAKRILFCHTEDAGNARFRLSEESDGTRRLLEYLPALFNAIKDCKTYFIDEIERSLHPVLIKELIRKFSLDPQTRGQLIFSTHESNLLDQEIFRPDEIWFVEKNKKGATQLYALSEFKEHHTIDIRKGYLNGRYGAIPFLSNLKDLNWEKYVKTN